ncbi:hypothetical protein A9Q74_16130 [Colwellia sp. 39_35_sub15_T18]|nr:hypothetical protein A9Q74_16130 [Colwellia sp. 39_35_sub15_T18]
MTVDVVKQTLNHSVNSEVAASEFSVPTTLLHELQLGEQLNESVHQARRADFSLMLAMLCDDVREQSQFVLPQQELTKTALDSCALRKQFELPEQAPLALKNLEQINQYNQAQYVDESKLTNIHLSNAMQPKPLAFRDDAQYIASSIMENTTLVCQEKHANEKADVVLNKRLAMDVNGWLKNIQTSLVKARVVVDVAA